MLRVLDSLKTTFLPTFVTCRRFECCMLRVLDSLKTKFLWMFGTCRRTDGRTEQWRECLKEPHYAVKGQRARTCFGHKEEDWVHVSRRRCDKDDCPRGAYFSLQGSTAIFCSAHRFVRALALDLTLFLVLVLGFHPSHSPGVFIVLSVCDGGANVGGAG